MKKSFSMIKCPHCGKLILSTAIKCKYCGKRIDTADEDITEEDANEESCEVSRKSVAVVSEIEADVATAENLQPKSTESGLTDYTEENEEDASFMSQYFFDILLGDYDLYGRVGRKKFWLWILSSTLFSICYTLALWLILTILPENETIQIIIGLFTLILVGSIACTTLCLAVCRLRDGGNSWLHMLWVLIPYVGWIVTLIKLCQESEDDI